MNISDLALRKITDYYETKEDIVRATLTMTVELVPEKCSSDGDILTLVFADGRKCRLDLWDCNSDYDYSGVLLSTKDNQVVYIS